MCSTCKRVRGGLRFTSFFGVPSCVPATIFETSGATRVLPKCARLLSDPRFTHLSEVMNVPGVLHGDPVLLGKLAAAQDRQIPIDGHAPGLFGEALREYVRHGISTDHGMHQLGRSPTEAVAGTENSDPRGLCCEELFDAVAAAKKKRRVAVCCVAMICIPMTL